MKRVTSTILASVLTVIVSSTALAGNIAAGRIAGHITTGRAAGNIPGGRANTAVNSPGVLPTFSSRFDLEGTISGSFADLIRTLLDAGALL